MNFKQELINRVLAAIELKVNAGKTVAEAIADTKNESVAGAAVWEEVERILAARFEREAEQLNATIRTTRDQAVKSASEFMLLETAKAYAGVTPLADKVLQFLRVEASAGWA